MLGQGSDPDGDSLIFKWSQVSGASCNIESPNKESSSISGLVPGYYYFRLEVSDGYEISSDMVRIAVKQNTVGSSAMISNALEVYPNPANNLIIINLAHYVEAEMLTISNTSGQLLLSKHLAGKKSKTEVDISELDAGIYFVKLYAADGSYVARIIKSSEK